MPDYSPTVNRGPLLLVFPEWAARTPFLSYNAECFRMLVPMVLEKLLPTAQWMHSVVEWDGSTARFTMWDGEDRAWYFDLEEGRYEGLEALEDADPNTGWTSAVYHAEMEEGMFPQLQGMFQALFHRVDQLPQIEDPAGSDLIAIRNLERGWE